MTDQAEQLGRGGDRKSIEPNPLTAHILTWFLDLSDDRHFNVVTGMAGGQCIPEAISRQELAAWMSITGVSLSFWEVETLKSMDRAWRSAYAEKKGSGTGSGLKHQARGEYCKGEKLAECEKQFGKALDTVCATCPN